MEVLRRRRAVGYADVALGAEREETLEPGAGVLGSLTFIAVGQQQREPRRLAPFRQPGNQELIDDHFGAVREITELCFPQDQRVLRLDGVTVLESQARVFRERTVMELEGTPGVAKMLDRRVAVAGMYVVQHQMALAECAALGVLARQADRRAVHQQRGEGERLGVRPFDPLVRGERVAAALELL